MAFRSNDMDDQDLMSTNSLTPVVDGY